MEKKTRKNKGKQKMKKADPPKAYNNHEFLNSTEARIIRISCELEEPKRRFRNQKIEDTIVFFGSARTLSLDKAKENLEKVEKKFSGEKKPSSKMKKDLEKAKRDLTMSRYYDDGVKLAEKLTLWSKNLEREEKRFIICSGGGGGIMEAANRGASKAKGLSIGLGISLPFEQGLNKYISHNLGFEFHYFFVRKFWFFYLAKALVVFPGGFGTMDEMFELLTLVQTKKTTKKVAIVVYGKNYWENILNFDELVKWGTINKEDLNLFKICDDVDEAFEYLKQKLEKHHL
jgi:uncharacterized protein (TIGR00730 family)